MEFTKHLLDAIKVNSSRLIYYGQKSYGTCLPLSLTLIFLEVSILPMALYFDFRGRTFNRVNINIIKNDFVSMHNCNSKNAHIKYKKRASKSVCKMMRKELDTLVQEVKKSNAKNDFVQVFKALQIMIFKVKTIEEASQSHFAMSSHILESLAFFAQHSMEYQKQSHSKSNHLTQQMITFQLLALSSSLFFDRWAQMFHEKGIGIIVNDMPHITL